MASEFRKVLESEAGTPIATLAHQIVFFFLHRLLSDACPLYRLESPSIGCHAGGLSDDVGQSSRQIDNNTGRCARKRLADRCHLAGACLDCCRLDRSWTPTLGWLGSRRPRGSDARIRFPIESARLTCCVLKAILVDLARQTLDNAGAWSMGVTWA